MRLATHGDPLERRYWSTFVADRFPSYERVWVEGVVPLTRRAQDPGDIRFLSRKELGVDRDEDVAVAQLHYTALCHIGHVHDLLRRRTMRGQLPESTPLALPGPGSAAFSAQSLSATGPLPDAGPADYTDAPAAARSVPVPFDVNLFTEAFVRLVAATDVADEILQRRAKPGKYLPWDELKGRDARQHWRKGSGDPLKRVRGYRDRLVHGRVVPLLRDEDGRSWFPRLEKVEDYLDWRPVQSLKSGSRGRLRGREHDHRGCLGSRCRLP